MKKFLPILIFAGFLVIPLLSLAAAPEAIRTIDDLKNLIIRFAGWVFLLLAAVAVVILLWATFEFITSEGNPDKVKTAKDSFTFAIIALVLAILARGMVEIVKSFFNIKF